jgi:putative oxidoreductase
VKNKKVVLAARILLGLIFFVFGLNGFLNFIPMNQPMPEAAMTYMGGLGATGYFFPVLKLTELISGVMLLSGYFVPMALILLSPIVLQIALFHFILAPAGAPLAFVILILQIYLGWAHLDKFASLLKKK